MSFPSHPPPASRRNTLRQTPTPPPPPQQQAHHSPLPSTSPSSDDFSDPEYTYPHSSISSSGFSPPFGFSRGRGEELIIPSLMDNSWIEVEHAAPESPRSSNSSDLGTETGTEVSSVRGTASAVGSGSDDGSDEDLPTGLPTATHTPFPSTSTKSTSSSWTDADKSSTTPTPPPSTAPLPPGPAEHARSTTLTSFSSSDLAELVASNLIFPMLEVASSTSSSMTHIPSPHASLIHPGASLGHSVVESDRSRESGESTDPLLPTRSGPRGLGIGHSFRAHTAYVTRIERGDAATPPGLGVGVGAERERDSGGRELGGRVDRAWLEAIARARVGMGVGGGVGEGLESGLGRREGWESSYVALEEGGEKVEVGGVEKEERDEEVVLDGKKEMEEGGKEGLRARVMRELGVLRKMEHAKRFAILALPLIAITLWATLSPVNPSSLFELHNPPPAHPRTAEVINMQMGTTAAKDSATKEETVATSLSVMYRSELVEVKPSPPKTTTTALIPLSDQNSSRLTQSPSPSPAPALAHASTKALSVLPASSDTSLMPHPLAFMRKSFATAQSGFQGARMEKRGRVRSGGVKIREGGVTKVFGPKRERRGPRGKMGSNWTVESVIVPPAPTDPASVAMQWLAHVSGGIAWVANLILDSAISWSSPLAFMRMELAHLARRLQSVVRDAMASPGEAKEVLLERVRKLKVAYGKTSWSSVREHVGVKEDIFHPAGEAFLAHQEQAAEALVETAWLELHSVFTQLDAQLSRIIAQGDQAIQFAQKESKRTMRDARKGLDNVLEKTANVVHRTTGVQIPVPETVRRRRGEMGGRVGSSKGEKVMQAIHHAVIAMVV